MSVINLVRIGMGTASNPIIDVNLNVPLVVFIRDFIAVNCIVVVGMVQETPPLVSMVTSIPVFINVVVVVVDDELVLNVDLLVPVEIVGIAIEKTTSVFEGEKVLAIVKING